MALYEVYLVYGDYPCPPEVQHKFVVADDAKQAELKSGLVADPLNLLKTKGLLPTEWVKIS